MADYFIGFRSGERPAIKVNDGTCCLVRDGILYKRYNAKTGKTPPAGFEPAQPEPDTNTGHWPGWLPVGEGPDDARHREAFRAAWEGERAWVYPGIYELCRVTVPGSPEGAADMLIRHGAEVLPDAPRTYDALADDALAQIYLAIDACVAANCADRRMTWRQKFAAWRERTGFFRDGGTTARSKGGM